MPVNSSSANDHGTTITDNLTVPSRYSIPSYNQTQETTIGLRDELETKDRETRSYKKTIETLTAELDEMRLRVRDLEQVRRESVSVSAKREEREKEHGVVEELKKEVSVEKSEKERYRDLLQEETKKVCKLMATHAHIRSHHHCIKGELPPCSMIFNWTSLARAEGLEILCLTEI